MSWRRPEIPRLPGHGSVPRIWDTASESVLPAQPIAVASLYVCGITPYDSTHLGHAATYLAYDTLIRLWLDAGFDVSYVQNSTDVDDPLLERALASAVDWRVLAEQQTDRFRGDMEALGIIPPDHYIAVTERIEQIADAVRRLADTGFAYVLDGDYYFDSAAVSEARPWNLGQESNYDRAMMLALSAERGGDPDRPGKHDPLDALLWKCARPGEPSWESAVGPGRPGWHIECSVISAEFLDLPLTVQGGGADLIFPHHEFTAGHTIALTGTPLAAVYSHAGLVEYRGEKMSKSLGNLVFVRELIESGVDGRAIRLALLSQRYRDNWEWTQSLLDSATDRLARWTEWTDNPQDGESDTLLDALRNILPEDLDTPAAVAAVDLVISSGVPASAGDLRALDALLGIRL
ncbi:MAG TPA: cysteine--1-D-myo-inosityl 2-amino-2-deoxy-alpha-D-glucopyranoside ligase [Galbitalea sp.]|nr:cysteine--1-D-myo-inosityl 2-amino-2-deoxy-alpha-D-glucopyranoside ligase [Galbitalea sp.]